MSDEQEPPRGKFPTIPGAASVPPPGGTPSRPAPAPLPVVAPSPSRPPPAAADASATDMPRPPMLPEFEAWALAADAVKSSPPGAADKTPVVVNSPVDTAAKRGDSAPPAIPKLTPVPPAPTSTPPPPPSSPESARRRSRRTVKIPVDATPRPPNVAAFEATPTPPVATAEAATPSPAPASEKKPASIPPRSDPNVIRPARIISIGEGPPPSNGTGTRAPMQALLDLGEVGQVPPGSTLEDFESLDDAAVESTRDSSPRGSQESLEEIEVARDSSPDVPVTFDDAPAPARKPPPPPPRRTTGAGDGPPQPAQTMNAQTVASFNATAPEPRAEARPLELKPEAPQLDTPLARPARRQKPWWEELFGDDFLRTMDKLEPNVVRRESDFIEDRLGVEKGAIILDLACGAGLHAVELSSRGYSVVGYDLSLAMLARAADEAQERGQKINFLQGDMREMAFDEMFDAVYMWNTSFGYFEDDANYAVLRRIHKALRMGGVLLIDVINRDYVACRQPSLVWFEGEGCVCMDEMTVDSFTSKLRVKRTVMFEDGRTREVDYAIRLYALHELGKMLHEVGFKVIEVTGHPAHPGVFFGSESPRIILLAERGEPKNRPPPPGVPGTTPNE